MEPWSNTFAQLMPQNHHKLSERFVWLLVLYEHYDCSTNKSQFLDTQRIHNLIQYLEQLHERRKATSDHTTLLLNCYAKLKDIKKLEAFIKSPGDLKFDLDTAIAMCRQGGYYEQAAYLAKKHGETELVVDILIEDSKSYDDALDYIWHQDPAIVCSPISHTVLLEANYPLGLPMYAKVC